MLEVTFFDEVSLQDANKVCGWGKFEDFAAKFADAHIVIRKILSCDLTQHCKFEICPHTKRRSLISYSISEGRNRLGKFGTTCLCVLDNLKEKFGAQMICARFCSKPTVRARCPSNEKLFVERALYCAICWMPFPHYSDGAPAAAAVTSQVAALRILGASTGVYRISLLMLDHHAADIRPALQADPAGGRPRARRPPARTVPRASDPANVT